ncbi:ATP-binding protein [Staphylococcus pseudintermedius]|nr:ATP-binding protein [Staphylococcus pseudintermedius]MCE5605716.1 ATP-binding protein [Staphylococcus pseudintermedius]MCE5607570.1 ATP-binding protein [Staphylococcus pseudintermedius]MCE5612625.1 ATP-binding protein [Staphylococcus pseudintermedius]MCE5706769.1 ATP-binding protein [Staphylococcus pseudintermedius]
MLAKKNFDFNQIQEAVNNIESVQKKIKQTDLEYICPNCKTEGLYIEYTDGSSLCVSCKCDNDRKKRISTPKEQEINFYWSASEIPRNLKEASFEKFEKELNKNVLNMWQGVKWFTNTLSKDNPSTLTLVGGIGVGKTHMAIASAREIKQKGMSVYFMSFSGLMRKIRQSFEKDNHITQSEIFRRIRNVDVFILDDVGVGSQTDYEMNVLYDIVNMRQGKSNIYTSNLGREEFTKNKNWTRIQSRLFDRQTTQVLKVVSTDYRQLPPF